MTSKLKILKILAAAVFVVAVAPATPALAEPLFHSEVEHTIGTGTQEEQLVFVTNAGTLKCKKVTGEGTLLGKTTSSATTIPAFSECTGPFGTSPTVSMNGCENIITADIEVHLVCPVGKTMSINAPGCVITVPPQSATSVEYINVGTGSSREIIAKEQGTGIHYTLSGFLCGTGTFTNGTAQGSVRTKGEDTNGKQVGIWWTDI